MVVTVQEICNVNLGSDIHVETNNKRVSRFHVFILVFSTRGLTFVFSILDQFDMANYKPITNLSTMSKILEKLAMHRLRPRVMSTGRFSECQSAYRLGH